MAKRLLIPAVAAGGLLLAGLGLGAAGGGPAKLTAKLDSKQEIPAAKGAAGASGLFTATLSGRTVSWRLTFSGLSGPATGGHVHLGKRGTAGPVAIPLCGPCASGARGKTVVSSKVAAALLSGAAYANVHTAKNPGGEIRGQVSRGGPSTAANPATTAPASTAPASTTPTSTTSDPGYDPGYGGYG